MPDLKDAAAAARRAVPPTARSEAQPLGGAAPPHRTPLPKASCATRVMNSTEPSLERRKAAGEIAVLGRCPKSGGGLNAGSGNGCNPWIPTAADTGLPLGDPALYDSVRQDLDEVDRHRVWRADLDEGQTLFHNAGGVTATYVVIEALCGQGSGCTYRVRYISHGGTVLWIRTDYHRRAMRHSLRDTFTVWPN